MTPEKRYEAVVRMLYAYDSATGNTGASAVIKEPWSWESNSLFPFYQDAASILQECLAEMDKASTKLGIPAVKRVLRKDDNRFSGIFTPLGSDWFCACDGHRLYRLKQDLPSLPHIETTWTRENVERIIPDDHGEELPLPAVPELKAHIARGKAEGRMPDRNPIEVADLAYNPQYLLDLLQAFPDVKLYRGNYFESEYADGVILPVHR